MILNVQVQDIAFVADLPRLKYLVLESCRIVSASFDTGANAAIEYIDLSYNALSRLPRLPGGAGSLRYLNVSHNKIAESAIPAALNGVLVCTEGNRLEFPSGVSREDFFRMLPVEITRIYQRDVPSAH